MNTKHVTPLELVLGKDEHGNEKQGVREALSAALQKVAPHTTLEAIGGDAEAIYGLLALSQGRPPGPVGPFCSIHF